jgi:DNA-binding transcriptional LysR family regulator
MTLQAFAEAGHIVVAPRDTWLPGPLPERAIAHVKGKLPIDVFAMPMELQALRVEMAWDERHHHDPAHKWLRAQLTEMSKTL